jgi:hypothetical protein
MKRKSRIKGRDSNFPPPGKRFEWPKTKKKKERKKLVCVDRLER